jgi:hypothetical protein
MATLIPEEGERLFCQFLRLVARPDSRYVAWYLPDADGTKKQAGF